MVRSTAGLRSPAQPRRRQSGQLGQPLQRLGEVEAFERHHEVDRVAVLAAAEAVIEALVGDDVNEGVFSLWNGQQPQRSRPRRVSRTWRPTTSASGRRALNSSSEMAARSAMPPPQLAATRRSRPACRLRCARQSPRPASGAAARSAQPLTDHPPRLGEIHPAGIAALELGHDPACVLELLARRRRRSPRAPPRRTPARPAWAAESA